MTQPIEPFVPVDPKRFDYAGDAVEFRARLDCIEECLKALTAALTSPQPAQEQAAVRDRVDRIAARMDARFVSREASQPAQEVDPIGDGVFVDLVKRAFIAYREASTFTGGYAAAANVIRTGIADLVKPVDAFEIYKASGALIDSYQLSRLESRGLRIIKEPGL